MADPATLLTAAATSAAGSAGSKGVQAASQAKSGGTGQLTPGVSPEQAALAQYTYGQNLLRDEQIFGASGTGGSTMETQLTGGSRLGEALTEAGQSDANLVQQFSQLQQLANNAGFNAGSQGTGTFNTTNTNTFNTPSTGGSTGDFNTPAETGTATA